MTITVWSERHGDYTAYVEQDKYSSAWRRIVFCTKRNYVWYQYDFYASKRSAIAAMKRQLKAIDTAI